MKKQTKPAAAVEFLKATVLNKADRQSFVNGVMDDVPKIDYAELIEAEGRKDLEAQLPSAIKKMMQDEVLSKYLNSCYATLVGYREMEDHGAITIKTVAHSFKTTDKFRARRAELMKLHNQQIETRRDLRNKLSATAEICKTDKQLAERLPEFAKYIPKKGSTITANVPALANLVADFTKAGWPKNNKGGVE